jgi:BirA family biotin operon repressor/biotin-[acetyl-CoA-carboxylase] ligase
VGIGINVNQTKFPKSIINPVSMKQITGKHFDPVALAKELSGHLEKRYHQLKNKEEAKMLAEYRSSLYKKYQEVKLKKGPIVFNAVIKDVSEQGDLIVNSGIKERFHFGEVEWVR